MLRHFLSFACKEATYFMPSTLLNFIVVLLMGISIGWVVYLKFRSGISRFRFLLISAATSWLSYWLLSSSGCITRRDYATDWPVAIAVISLCVAAVGLITIFISKRNTP